MPLTIQEKNLYAAMIRDIFDKILITGKKGFAMLSRALRLVVLKHQKVPSTHIAEPIKVRAMELRDLIENKDIWVPVDESQSQDAHYMRRRHEEQNQFANIVKKAVKQKICYLSSLTAKQKAEIIQENRQRMMARSRQKPVPTRPKDYLSSVESDGYVALRNQWRTNLLEPFDISQALTMKEFAQLASLVDTEKYPWGYAQVLTANLPLAKWLGSDAIFELIEQGFLDCQNEGDLALLAEPSQSEMQKLSLFSYLIQHEWSQVQEVLDLALSAEDQAFLIDPAFQLRAKNDTLLSSDLDTLSDMGLNIPLDDNDEDEMLHLPSVSKEGPSPTQPRLNF